MSGSENDLSAMDASTIDPSKQIVKDPAKDAAGKGGSFLAELRSASSTENADGLVTKASGGGKKVSTPAVLVAVVLTVCAGLLWGMRKLGVGPLTGFDEVKIDYTPEGGAKNGAHKKLLIDLERSSQPVQVPTEQITKNPFKLAGKPNDVIEPARDNSDEILQRQLQATAKRKADHEKMVVDTLASLTLQGVLGGTIPVARVSGETVRVGDTLGEIFTVKSITGRTVTLETDGKEFQLTMEEPKQNNGKGAKKK